MEYSFIVNPDFESAYLDCADTCLQIKDYERALEIYIEANSKFGPNNELMVNIAHCYIYMDRISIAKQWLLKSIKLDAFNDDSIFSSRRMLFERSGLVQCHQCLLQSHRYRK
ncbi:MAG: hypothetical protein IPO48_12530 [Saprospiraceae bacterium]|nr:hypothetical protein [Saprospiraceae bacterium]